MKNQQDKESRLDRIERGLDLLLQGTSELKESQKKTDEQLNKTIKKLDDIGRQLGDLGLVQGEVAEDLFYRNVLWTPSQGQFSPKLRCVSFCFLTQLFMLPFEQFPSPNTPQQVFLLRTTDVVVQSCKTQNIL